MRVLIADDEAPARKRLSNLVQEIGEGLEVVAEAATGADVLRSYGQLQPDVLLLDIRMPRPDGIEVAKALAELGEPPAVIFTTAYEEHALQAFEGHAVDYLLKPVRRERLAEALTRARRVNRAQIAALGDLASGSGRPARTHICAQLRGSLEVVPLDEVVYFQADHKYVTVRHRGGELLIEESLKSLESEFAGRFLRIHRNALVAITCLAGLVRMPEGQCLARLSAVDEQLEISRRHLPQVRKLLRRGKIF
jgi:two-component system response regulator AlgR